MNWRARYFFSFVLALCGGAFVGLAAGLLLQLNRYELVIVSLLGALCGVAVLWLLAFKNLSKLMQWLAHEDTSPPIEGLPGHTYWGELVRRFSKTLRLKNQQIEEKEKQLSYLFLALQSAPIGILLLDAQERLVWGNDKAAAYFGLSFPQDYQQQITNLVRFPEFVAYLSDLRQGQNPSPLKLSHTLEKKRFLLMQMVTDQSHFYRLLLIQDITEQEQMNQMRVDFVANVSHEIRTPLTVLSGFIETMQQLPLEVEERNHYLHLMAQQSDRIHRLVNDLLILARLESSMPTQINTWNDMNELFDQATQVVQELSNGKHQVTYTAPTQNIQVEVAGDTSEILSAITNIVSNAIRYTPQGGHIHLGWQLNEKQECVFYVKDDGPGIAQKHLGRLTERFYRIDKGRSQQSGGTGLGLAITKHVMQRYGGRLEIESSLGQGSQFSLHFVKINLTDSAKSSNQ